MKTVCDANKCNGCMACLAVCPRKCITIRDDIYNYNAVIDQTACLGIIMVDRFDCWGRGYMQETRDYFPNMMEEYLITALLLVEDYPTRCRFRVFGTQ